MPKPMLKISLLLLSALALSACGSLEGKRTDPKKTTQAIKTGVVDPELKSLADSCIAQQGRLSSDGRFCLTKITVALPPFASLPQGTSKVVIDPSFTSGKFVVATGNTGANQGAVDITFANRAYLKVPARVLADFPTQPQSGELAFYVNGGSYTDVVATVWTCFERRMSNRVYCPASIIP